MGTRRGRPHTTTRVVAPAAIGTRAEAACVVVVNGAQLGVEAEVGDHTLVIGRAEECELLLDDNSVSRRHCRIIREGNGFLVEDLGSTNGVFVNGEKVTRFALRDGDRLRVGHCELKFFGVGSSEASYHRELLNHAVFDALTAFYNRRQFREMLDHAFDRGRFQPGHLRVMILDLDHFKPVNDQHGHLAGDRVLAGFSALVREFLDVDATAGRLGGEEFAIFSPVRSNAEFLSLAQTIRCGLQERELPIDPGVIRVTVSIGIAAQSAAMRSTADLLRAADAALYRAKLEGRNRVVEAVPER